MGEKVRAEETETIELFLPQSVAQAFPRSALMKMTPPATQHARKSKRRHTVSKSCARKLSKREGAFQESLPLLRNEHSTF